MVRFEGVGLKAAVELTVEDLKRKFPQHSVNAVIQCAGNRRSEFNRKLEGKPPVKGETFLVKIDLTCSCAAGLGWNPGAISNAIWTGPRLREVLQYVYGDMGVPDEVTTDGHVQFWGRDGDGQHNYGASVPAPKVAF